VGECFDSVYDLNVTLRYSDGGKMDVSRRPFYFNALISDAKNNTYSSKTPFTTPGAYTLQLQYRGDLSLKSNLIPISVVPADAPVLTLRKDATANFTYENLVSTTNNADYLAPSGDINCLVIPVNVKDFPFAEQSYKDDYRKAIDEAFNGQGKTDTSYWESVSSFYEKSSYGKLKLHFDIADVYDPDRTSQDLLKDNGIDLSFSGSLPIINEALTDYINRNGSGCTQKYDNNHDGYVDGLWLIYSAPDCSVYDYGSKNALFYWAVTGSTPSGADPQTPKLCSFSWASFDFLYKFVGAPKVDAHTLIHETGHLLSLPDYYSYDLSSGIASGPQGGLAMMDLNIGDHDAFSKVALGWSDPYVVEDNCTITIKPQEDNGDCILLSDHWNGTAFDEYLLLDLQNGSGLSELDASSSYDRRPAYYSMPGIRMLHVDARLGAFKYAFAGENGNGTGYLPYQDSTQGDFYCTDEQVEALAQLSALPEASNDPAVPYAERSATYSIINANSATRSLIKGLPYSSYHELSLIGADNINPEIDDTYGHNASLFHAGDSWSLSRRGAYFFTNGGYKLNNGNRLNWVMNVLSCDSNSATIQFRKY